MFEVAKLPSGKLPSRQAPISELKVSSLRGKVLAAARQKLVTEAKPELEASASEHPAINGTESIKFKVIPKCTSSLVTPIEAGQQASEPALQDTAAASERVSALCCLALPSHVELLHPTRGRPRIEGIAAIQGVQDVVEAVMPQTNLEVGSQCFVSLVSQGHVAVQKLVPHVNGHQSLLTQTMLRR